MAGGFRSVLAWLGLSGGGEQPPTPPPVPEPSPGYELFIIHYKRDGELANFLFPLEARYTNSVDGDEPLVFVLNADHEAVADLEEFDILEVLIRNIGLGIDENGRFVRDFVGILREWERATDEDGITTITYIAPEGKHMLGWRHVLWPAGTAERATFSDTPAETVMKTLIEYNCTAAATVGNGRQREGDLAPGMGIAITIASDQGRGESLSLSFMGGNLLNILATVAAGGGGDYSLVWQGGSYGGAADEWLFEFHPGQRGGDKSSGDGRVLFSLQNQTMLEPRLRRRAAGATVALSAGQGQGSDRAVDEVQGADYAAGNDLEMFVDARNEASQAGRIYRGLEKLHEKRARGELDFRVQQTADTFYSPVHVPGRNTYHVGDLILASYGGDFVRKITRAIVTWQAPASEDALQIEIETEDV